MTRGKFNTIFISLFSCALAIIFIECDYTKGHSQNKSGDLSSYSDTSTNTNSKEWMYGYNTDSFYLEKGLIAKDQVLGDLLQEYGVPYPDIFELSNKAKDIFSVRNLRYGKKYAIVRDNMNGDVVSFIYEPSPFRFVEYSLRDSISVNITENDYEICDEEISGIVTSSLWASMADEGYVFELIVAMEEALAWSVSFQYIQPGDSYKLIIERLYIDGIPVGIRKLKGAYFNNMGNEFYSIYFDSPQYAGFYDEVGLPMKKAFLKAPVQYSRISSRFSLRRFHPVLKRYKGHFGTDFAAPCGTPIMAVAEGVVTKASRTSGNGNYIKIKHDKVYETQYLHMTKFAAGIKPGVHVKQAEVIGYVGQTGLATGCHVCFRFWKNNKQIDFLREKLPPPEPMPAEALPAFLKERDIIKKRLDEIPAPISETII